VRKTTVRALFFAAVIGIGVGHTAAPGHAQTSADDPAARLVRRTLGQHGARWPRQPLVSPELEAVGIGAVRALHDATGYDTPHAKGATRGRGATVCIVDSGIDLAHRDFLDRHGRTRVRFVLDLDAPPRGVHPMLEAEAGGAVWSAGDIDAARSHGAPVPLDATGHGTAVASVAAGDDAGDDASPGPWAGAAPEADLVVVRAHREGVPGFRDEDILIGVRFCQAATDDVARTVIVLALGGHDGVHDGSEPIDRALTAEASRGAILVAAAGNGGDRAAHVAATLLPGERLTIPIEVPAIVATSEPRHLALTIEGGARVGLVAPDGTATGWTSTGDRRTVVHDRGRITVDRTRAGTTLGLLTGGESDPGLGGGRYALLVEGPGQLDAWIASERLGPTFTVARFTGPFVDESDGVTIPATSPGVLAVGATVVRPRIETDRDAISIESDLSTGVARFSARGPSATGAPKPAVVAPGVLVAALSHDMRPESADGLFGGSIGRLARARIGEERVVIAGTSLAAPLVAGAIALRLARQPLAPSEVHALVTATARSEAVWDPARGFGVLDALALWSAPVAPPSSSDGAVGAWSPRTSGLTTTRALLTPRATDVSAVVRLRTEDGRPRPGVVRMLSEEWSAEEWTTEHGIAVVPVDTRRLVGGDVLSLEAWADGRLVGAVQVPVVRDEARAREGLSAAGGGCAVSAARDGSHDAGFGGSLVIAIACVSVGRAWVLRARPRRDGRCR
jgi:subtilisin family serine protease